MSAVRYELSQHPQLWGETTDPATHDPANFRYLVHAVNPFAKLSALKAISYDHEDGAVPNKNWGDQSINMYDEPERLAERVSLSMSLIDQDHTATWGNVGLIVEAPVDNILFTDTSDVGSHNNNLDFLHRQARDRHVMDGDALLRFSSPVAYNEVVAIADQDGKQVQLKGFFYTATASGEPYDEDLYEHMKAHAERLGLPIVPVTKHSQFGKDEVSRSERHSDRSPQIAVNFNGRRYLLEGFDAKFQVIDEKGSYQFAAPHEIEEVLSFAVASGSMDEAETAKIAAAYKEADERRQTPVAIFDDDGSFKQIRYRTGYGAEETEITLNKSGYGSHVNLAEQSKKMSKLFAAMNSGKPIISSGYIDADYMPISLHEADAMVAQACAQLDAEKAAEIRSWYSGNRDKVLKNWQNHQALRSSFQTLRF